MNTEAIARILEILTENNLSEEADTLEDLVVNYFSSSKEDKIIIARKIKDMCHPKWLGDLYVKSLSISEWYSLLNKLSKSI
ncbi:MAG: hypothetical protein VB050_15715 [Geobacteraceae bacterium]|nr:hypothetical protein [Geobacteraceae bacterium]